MSKVLFADFGLKIIKRQSALYVRYGVDELAVFAREDSISEVETNRTKHGESDACEVLLAIQQRLIAAGIDPYVPNIKHS